MKQFAEIIKNLVQEKCPEKEISLVSNIKNNGVVLTGIIIKNPGETISPTVYVEPLFHGIISGKITIEEAVSMIIACADKHRTDKFNNIRSMLNKEYVYEHVQYKLVNTKKNSALLSTVPHYEFLDLSVVYTILLPSDGREIASITLKNDLVNLLGIDIDEVKKRALENTRKNQKYSIQNINKIRENIPKELLCMMDIRADYYLPIYVIDAAFNGCNVLMDTECLDEVADLVGGDLFILPSSIYEVIAIPKLGLNAEECRDIVKSVNTSGLPDTDVLSDNVYTYSKDMHKLSIA